MRGPTYASGMSPGGGSATITGDDVEITAAGTYKLEAVTTCGSSTTLASIGDIFINPSVTGTVTVFIESRSNNNTPGAVNVGSINLTNTAGVTGNLQELRITGDLGVTGPILVRSPSSTVVSVGDDVVDTFTINGDLNGDITSDSMEDIVIGGTVAASDTITANIVGDISIAGDLSTATGLIDVGQAGSISIGGFSLALLM